MRLRNGPGPRANERNHLNRDAAMYRQTRVFQAVVCRAGGTMRMLIQLMQYAD